MYAIFHLNRIDIQDNGFLQSKEYFHLFYVTCKHFYLLSNFLNPIFIVDKLGQPLQITLLKRNSNTK